MLVETFFWLLVFLICYTYLFYPLILLVISGMNQGLSDSFYVFNKADRRRLNSAQDLTVAVVIAAFNEEKHVVERINNLLSQDYPKAKLKIYIGSDGSSDNTVKLVKNIKDERVILFDFPENRGKVSVLNELLENITESVVVYSDANTFFKPDAIKKLIRHFEDNEIAGVCGELQLVDVDSSDNKDSAYWKLERFLKYHEGKINGFLGANGAIYALRRENCSSLPTDTIIDDFTMFMNVGLSGKKVIYDIEAIAEEEVAPNMAGEYKRRVRIGMGNYQAFFRMLNALHPKQKWRAFTYFSHKVVRWFTPHFMLSLLLINLLLLDEFIYQILFGLQVLLYLTTFIVVNFYSDRQLPSIIRLPIFLVNMNVALGHGFIKYTVGNSEGTWQRTER